MSFSHILKKLGFSDKKSAIYLALLENGESSVRDLAKQTNIRRTTVYDVIASLEKMGLVSAANGQGDKRTFLAEDPERLAELIEEQAREVQEQKQRLEEQQAEMKELVPQLKSLGEAVGKPRAQFFEGGKGLVQALSGCLLQKQPILIYGSLDPWKRWMPDHFEWYAGEIEKRKIEVKRIEAKTLDKLRGMTADEVTVNWPVRYPPIGFAMPGFSLIYGNKVMLASFQKPMATVIEDKDYSAAQRALFDAFWQFLREG